MKKNVFITVAFVALTSLFFTNVQAQNSNFTLGGGIAHETDLENIGIYAKGTLLFTPQWEGALTGTYYFEDIATFTAFDADVHYLFYNNEENMVVYSITGLNFRSLKNDYASASSVGFNLGLGMRYQLSETVSLNPALKYILGTESGDSYFGLSVGLCFNF